MGFQSPNHTQTPNDFFEMISDMTDVELRVTLATIRNTLGYHKKRFRLSLSKMQKMTGLSKQGVLNGAELAEKRGTIKREQDGGVTIWVVNTVDQSVNTVDQTGQHSRPPSKKESNKRKVGENPTSIIKATYIKLLGYKPDDWAQGEAKAAKTIGAKWTPEQLSTAYLYYKSQSFWSDKRLRLRNLKDLLPEYFKNGAKHAHATNGTTKRDDDHAKRIEKAIASRSY